MWMENMLKVIIIWMQKRIIYQMPQIANQPLYYDASLCEWNAEAATDKNSFYGCVRIFLWKFMVIINK